MKKILVLVILMMFLVGCKNNGVNNNGNDGVDASLEAAKDTLIDVNGTTISLTTFNKYYAMQSYDFEKEYGEQVWNIEQDGKTMAEIRQDQTIDYLIRVSLIQSFINEKGISVDQNTIDEAYVKYRESIKGDADIKTYFGENAIDEAFLKRFLEDQYYLRIYQEQMFEELSNDAATESLLFDNQFIRYKTRHILLATKEAFDEVFVLLNDEENPADFSDLARLYSIHSTSAVKGGDLGYKTVGEMPLAYEQLALTIEPYTVSEVFETELGFHIIFVDDRQMLQDMIDSGMPEDQLASYKSEIVKNYAAGEMVRVFNAMREAAQPNVNRELLIEE